MSQLSQNNKSIEQEEWYQILVDECKAIVTESVFTSRWALVEGYWSLGKRIRDDKLAQEYEKGNKTFVQDLGRNIGVSTSTIYYALQAYDKYPDQQFPEGKNISWNKLITKYLPDSPQEPEVLEKETEFCQCPQCGFVFKPVRMVKEKVLKITGKKYSSIKDITEEDMLEIASSYKVGLGFVKLQYEKMRNYCESKGKVYKNYKSALRNFVLGDMQRVVERRAATNDKRGVDARNV